MALGSGLVLAVVGAAAVPSRGSPPTGSARRLDPPPARWADGILTVDGRRYAVGEPGDHVLVAPWACGPPGVALLRRATGEVVAFDRLPLDDRPVVARRLARVADAERLVVRPDGRRCPSPAVETAAGGTRSIPWKEAP